MKQGLSEIVCILDRSGSMSSIIDEAIGGLNTFIDEQKAQDGEAKITIALFDDHYDVVNESVDINSIDKITNSIYFPRGMTALYDAVGKTVTSVGERLSNTPEEERPENVVVAILTDGMENCSREYTAEKIKEIIEHQEEKYNWTFVYLAANQDAFDVGQHFGMKGYNSINFNANAGGAKGAFTNMSSVTTAYRCASRSMSKSAVMASVDLKDADGN